MAALFTGNWKGSSTATVPFGLKDGRLWFVSDVEAGLACGCRCPDPACDQPLVARNRAFESRQRAYHFQHVARTVSCGGRESALHRMAKELLMEATRLVLPAWSGSGHEVEASPVALAESSRAEVRLLDGQARSDVSVQVLAAPASLAELHVEVRVRHAVDDAKARLVRERGLTMMEIDLSDVPDDLVADRDSFMRLVLEEPRNRSWIHVGNAELLSGLLGVEVIEVAEVSVHDKSIPFKKGQGHWLHTCQAVVSRVAGREPWPTMIELESYLGDPSRYRDTSGAVVSYGISKIEAPTPSDRNGTPIPYAPGLYFRGYSFNRYKTVLVPVRAAARVNRPGFSGDSIV